MKTIIFILLTLSIALADKVPYITNLMDDIVSSNYSLEVINSNKGKIYKQHEDFEDYKFIFLYKDYAVFKFNSWDIAVGGNHTTLYKANYELRGSIYIILKKEKEKMYLKNLSFLKGNFKLVGVKKIDIYPHFERRFIHLKEIK